MQSKISFKWLWSIFSSHDLSGKGCKLRRFILILILVVVSEYGIKVVFAQTGQSLLYVPLIGITSVPEPLALPKGVGDVTYNYAVKNFLREVALTNIQVADNKCSPVEFVNGDDNGDFKLDYSETWRYACTAKLSKTTESIALATGMANNLTATHKAYATVIVGSSNPPPLVSIINITKVAYPFSLPTEGGQITFTYKVNNPGVVPLSNVTVVDDKCNAMSGKLGDVNGNSLLDINEVWIYTCTATLRQTTTNTAHVEAFANGLKAIGDATITVKVDAPNVQNSINFPDTGENFNLIFKIKITVWLILLGILAVLIIFFFVTKKNKLGKK